MLDREKLGAVAQKTATPWLWPSTRKAEPGGFARFGRVLHWTFVVWAGFGVLGTFVGLVRGIAGDEEMFAASLGTLMVTLVLGLLGRAALYVFAGE